MSSTRRFVCAASFEATSSFEKEIPRSLIERSDFLTLAELRSPPDDSPVHLVLPSGIDSDCMEAWLTLNLSTEHPARTYQCEAEKTPPQTLVQALQAADFFADELALEVIHRRIAQHLLCPSHDQQNSPRARQRRKLGILHDCHTLKKQFSRSAQKQRTANKKILQQIPTHIVLSILHQLDFLSCIRNLPAAYHALAIEAHHSEVMKKKQLRMAPARQHCDESVHAEVVTAIAELQQLTSLQLHGFWISQCKSVMQKRLRALFTSLHNLRELQFPDGVNSGTAQVLMDSVESLSALETLDILGHTQVAGMQPHALPPQELNGLLHSFRDMRALKSLTLSGFKRDSEEMVEFCAALKHLTGLTKLELSRCFLKLIDKGYVCTGSRLSRQVGDGLRVTQRLGGALKKLKLLEHLDLSHSFPRDYVEPVLDAIACLTKLTCLNLQDMNTMSSMRFEFPHNVPMNIGYGKRLVPMLNRLQQLQCINLSSYPLFEDVWPGLGAAMASLTKLTALILERVAEGEAFWDSTFCPNVTHLVNLRMLSLSGNYSINDRNAWAIGKALAELPALQTLYMCTCEIRREGAVALSGHFKSLTGLTQLALRDNRMGPRGAKAIAESLKCMLNLSALSLTFHCIGSEGARAIKSALVSSLGQDWIHQMSYCSGLEPGILGQDWEASDAEFEEGVQVQWQQWHAADMAELLQAPPLIALHWFQAMMLDAMI